MWYNMGGAKALIDGLARYDGELTEFAARVHF